MSEIKREVIELKLTASRAEVGKYGKEGLKQLWIDVLERYASEEYYDPDLVQQMLEAKAEES